MTLRARYEAFLAAPTLDALTGGASLHYVPTTTSINTGASIIKHLGVQDKMLKRKGDKVLEAIESAHGLSIELETTLEFVHGGGAFLPGLDDNFIADKTVTFPSVSGAVKCRRSHADSGPVDPRGALRQVPEDFPDPRVLGPRLPA